MMGCKCRFHHLCIEEWTKNSKNCPTCGTVSISATVKRESYEDLLDIWYHKFSGGINIDTEDKSDMSVRRCKLFTDTLKKIPRILKKGLVPLNVMFTDEFSTDYGGPTREFFTEIFGLVVGKLVHGDTRNFTFIHDLVRLGNNEYLYFGFITALALVHGCPGPRYFCKSVAEFIFRGDAEPSIEEVADSEMREKLKELRECNDRELFENQMKVFFERFDSGFVAATVSYEEKDKLLKTMARHHVISCAHEEITQYITGIRIGHVLSALKCHESKFLKEFIYDEKLITADCIKRIFKVPFYSSTYSTLLKLDFRM